MSESFREDPVLTLEHYPKEGQEEKVYLSKAELIAYGQSLNSLTKWFPKIPEDKVIMRKARSGQMEKVVEKEYAFKTLNIAEDIPKALSRTDQSYDEAKDLYQQLLQEKDSHIATLKEELRQAKDKAEADLTSKDIQVSELGKLLSQEQSLNKNLQDNVIPRLVEEVSKKKSWWPW